jgi:hypothetical protein
MTSSIYYQGGTLVLKDPDPAIPPPAPYPDSIRQPDFCP